MLTNFENFCQSFLFLNKKKICQNLTIRAILGWMGEHNFEQNPVILYGFILLLIERRSTLFGFGKINY